LVLDTDLVIPQDPHIVTTLLRPSFCVFALYVWGVEHSRERLRQTSTESKA